MTTELVSLNCLLSGDKEGQVFTVKIPKTNNVSILQKVIKEKKNPHLNHLSASDLKLFQVSLPVDDNFEERIKHIPLEPLNPLISLSKLFYHVESDHLHIVIQAPPQATISPSSSNESNAISDTNSHVLLGLRELHAHLWGEDRIVYKPEMACSILDFGDLCLNIHPDKVLLFRKEYVLAYEYILRETLKCPTTERQRSATLVTGQSGIGASTLGCMVLVDLA
ncbi:hypothetical protein APHAL10511_004199 [Amanita phalloides]|nr:hypothetical protein APHAL10511_004199 [Amanita phalloides]